MEKVLYIFVHYGVLAVIALLALRAPVRSRAGLAAAAILGLCICLFLFFWGQWPLVGSYYARYLTMAVALIVAGRAVRVWPADSPLFPPSFPGKAAFVLDIALIALTLRLVAGAVGGLSYGGDPAELTLPLKNGTYYVASGGSSKVLNGHMRSRPTAQQFALDINKLGALGGASRNILSSDNEGHHIFGESVFAPCEGEVTSSAADIADNRGSSMDVSVEDGSGNHVTIDCGGLVVSMLHAGKRDGHRGPARRYRRSGWPGRQLGVLAGAAPTFAGIRAGFGQQDSRSPDRLRWCPAGPE